MKPQEIIERYAHEVGRHLPRKLRADVQAELSSLLDEMVEQRAEAAGRAPDEALAVEVLREFGKPAEVAGRYGSPNQLLIGPELYPAFILVLKIMLAVLVGLFVFGSIYALSQSATPQEGLGRILSDRLPNLIDNALTNLGLLVLVFAVLQRFVVSRAIRRPEWDPRQLPKVEDPDRVDRAGLIVSVIINAALLILFKLNPNWLSAFVLSAEGWGGLALLAPSFLTTHLPWLMAAWTLEAVLSLAVLWFERWTPALRWAKFALSAFGIFILYQIVTGGPILALSALDPLIRLGMVITLTITAIEAAVQLYRLVLKPSEKPALFSDPHALSRG